VTLAAVKSTASAGKNMLSLLKRNESNWKDDLQKMFDDARSHIQDRQKLLANEIIELRDNELKSWMNVLREG
jgi:phosphate uptake regulator